MIALFVIIDRVSSVCIIATRVVLDIDIAFVHLQTATYHIRHVIPENQRALQDAPHREMGDCADFDWRFGNKERVHEPYSSYDMPPFPTSSISRSFQWPGPAFCPTGAAKSMILAIAQSRRCAFRCGYGEYDSIHTEARKFAVQNGGARAPVVVAVEALDNAVSICPAMTAPSFAHVHDVSRNPPAIRNGLRQTSTDSWPSQRKDVYLPMRSSTGHLHPNCTWRTGWDDQSQAVLWTSWHIEHARFEACRRAPRCSSCRTLRGVSELDVERRGYGE